MKGASAQSAGHVVVLTQSNCLYLGSCNARSRVTHFARDAVPDFTPVSFRRKRPNHHPVAASLVAFHAAGVKSLAV